MINNTVKVYLDNNYLGVTNIKQNTSIKNIKDYGKIIVFKYGDQNRYYKVDFYPTPDTKLDFEKITDDLILKKYLKSFVNPTINVITWLPPKIRIRKHQGNRGSGIGYPKVKGWENIPAWSRGSGDWKKLSPFIIGPVSFCEEGKEKIGFIFENFWQSFKVYPKVDKQNQGKQKSKWIWPSEIHVDQMNLPNNKWWKWHDALLDHKYPVRRPNGKNVPLYALYKGQKLDVVEARKQIYIPYLQELYRKNPVYKCLLKKVKEGDKIIILEPDGPCLDTWPNGMDVDLELLKNLQDVTKKGDVPGAEKCKDSNRYFPYGHGYVIALTIFEDISNNSN